MLKKLNNQMELLFELPKELRAVAIEKATELKNRQAQLEKDLEAAKSVVSAKTPQWTADDVVDLLHQVAENLSKCLGKSFKRL